MPVKINKSGSGSIGVVLVGTSDDAQPPDVIIARETENTVLSDREGLSFDFTEQILMFTDGDVFTEDILFDGNGISDIADFVLKDDGTGATANLKMPTDSRGNVVVTVVRNAVNNLDTPPLQGPPRPRSVSLTFNTRLPRLSLSYQYNQLATQALLTISWDQDVEYTGPPIAMWNDAKMKTGIEGTLTKLNDRIWTITYDFPEDTQGNLSITIPVESGTAIAEPKRAGDPVEKSITIPYDTRIGDTIEEPAFITISKPNTEIYPRSTYTCEIITSAVLDGFTDDDVEVDGVTKGALEQDPLNPLRYTVLITMTGSGTAKVKIPAGAAQAAGIDSPAEDVEVEWQFDVDTPSIATTPTGNTICMRTWDFNDNIFLKGAFIGVSDSIEDTENNTGYCVLQIQKQRVAGELSESEQAGAALVWYSLDSDQCGLVKVYPHITQAPRSPVIHEDKVLYFEGSHYIYNFRPDAPADTYEDEIGYVIEVSRMGVIRRTLTWRSQFPTSNEDRFIGIHGGTKSPLISDESSLYALTGWGRTDFAIARQAEAGENDYGGAASTDYRNWQMVVWGTEYNQRVTQLNTNSMTGWQVLENLARVSNSFIGFDNNRFVFKSNDPTRGRLSGAMLASASSLSITKTNRDFPEDGYIAIGNEILEYSNSFATLERGQNGTVAEDHALNSIVVYVDHIINADHFERPVLELDSDLDNPNLFNKIVARFAIGDERIRHASEETVTLTDDESIEQHGEKVLELELDLSIHQGFFAERLALAYLNRFSKLQYLIKLSLKPVFHWKLGQVVAVREPVIRDTNRVGRIVAINQNYQDKSTEIIIRTISL